MTTENPTFDDLYKRYKCDQLKEHDLLSILAAYPEHDNAWFFLGWLYNDNDDYPRALAAFDRQIALVPDHSYAHFGRGYALSDLRRFDEALAAFDRLIALVPDHNEAHNGRGNALSDLRRFDEALAAYDRQIALVPDHSSAHNGRGNALSHLRRFDEALAAYDRQIDLVPDHNEAHNGRGSALIKLLRFDEALAAFDRQIALVPDHSYAHNGRGNALSDLRRFDEALAAYDRQITINRNNINPFVDVYLNRAILLIQYAEETAMLTARRSEALGTLYAGVRIAEGALTIEYIITILTLIKDGVYHVPLLVVDLLQQLPFVLWNRSLLTGMDVPDGLLTAAQETPVKTPFLYWLGGHIPKAYAMFEALDDAFQKREHTDASAYFSVQYYYALCADAVLETDECLSILRYAVGPNSLPYQDRADNEGHYYLGLCHLTLGDHAAAARHFQNAAQKGYLAAHYGVLVCLAPELFAYQSAAAADPLAYADLPERFPEVFEYIRSSLIPAEAAHCQKNRPYFLGIDFGKTGHFKFAGTDRSLPYYLNYQEMQQAIGTAVELILKYPEALPLPKGIPLSRRSFDEVANTWQRRRKFTERMEAVKSGLRLEKLGEEINAVLPGYTNDTEHSTNIDPKQLWEIAHAKISETTDTANARKLTQRTLLRCLMWHYGHGRMEIDSMLKAMCYTLICRSAGKGTNQKIEDIANNALEGVASILAAALGGTNLTLTTLYVIIYKSAHILFFKDRIQNIIREVINLMYSNDSERLQTMSYEDFCHEVHSLFEQYYDVIQEFDPTKLFTDYRT